MAGEARAFWVVRPGVGEVRTEVVPEPGDDEVQVRAVCSAVSRGTERLVFSGRVPPDQHERMRAPLQVGDFPGPLKYGYLSVGVVEQGPARLLGRHVFCLHPHQTRYVAPLQLVTPVPDDVPAERAVLAGTVETALNALWDACPLPGDRVTVMGGGMVGCCLARLVGRFPGVTATLVDVEPSRRSVAKALEVDFSSPEDAPGGQDLVFHTTATAAGLQTSLDRLADDGTVVELSWYGDTEVRLRLGGDFHSRRLGVRASQVGAIPPTRRARWTTERRRTLAMELLRDPAYDHLVTGRSRFDQLPEVMARLADGSLDGICHTVSYE